MAEANNRNSCDVFVVGGGPAGSTIAALLAAEGRQVTLADKDRHPRFHIGESLLPRNMPLLEKLGIKQEIADQGMLKLGIEFVHAKRDQPVMINFADSWDKSFSYSYQVRRSVFDHSLLKNAAAKGAEVIEGCRVNEIDFLPEGGALVHATDESGVEHIWQTRFLVDATGRDTLLANKMSLKARNPRHNSAALYGHFTNAKRLPGTAEGNISIFWFAYGWFWIIPLADGVTSVGAVCRPDYIKSRQGGDMTQFLMDTIALCPKLAERLQEATLTAPATATGNYSYSASRMTGDSYIMVGDAYAFIDPVFSTGVFLAMRSGFLGAKAVAECLDHPQRSAMALRHFDREVRRAIDTFSWFIYRINTYAMRELIMSSRKPFRLESAVLSLLGGDVAKYSPIKPRLLLFKAIYYLVSLKYLGNLREMPPIPQASQPTETMPHARAA